MDVNWNIVLGEVATQVLRIMLPMCAVLILKWAMELWIRLKESKPDIAKLLSCAVQIAVDAAEQIYGDGHGESKKAYAVAYVEKYLAEHGVKLNVQVIADAIEAKVWTEFTQWKGEEQEDATTNTTE